MRKMRVITVLGAALILAAFAATALAGEVFQGVAVSYDAATKKLVLKNTEPDRNKVPKDMAEVTFDTGQAKIGLLPTAGDKVRVAYDKQGDKLVALKIMNVTKQDLRKK
ncbi:MAG: hypothetical protein ACOZHQ_00495 [Thermodesulfobacteriota bacterium]